MTTSYHDTPIQDNKNNRIFVRQGKGMKDRTLPFSPRTGLFYVSGKNDAVSNKVRPVGNTLKPGPRSPGHFEALSGTEKHGMKCEQN